MSVILPIEIPKYCLDCPCHDGEYGVCNLTRKTIYDVRPNDCPIQEVELGVQLSEIPDADVQKVIHAHWVDAEGILVCSHCGHATEDSILEFDGTAYVSRIPYFCGKCGAKMDGKEE